jgi:hypothetical protein
LAGAAVFGVVLLSVGNGATEFTANTEFYITCHLAAGTVDVGYRQSNQSIERRGHGERIALIWIKPPYARLG